MKELTRQDVLDIINKIIEEELGEPLTEDQLLIDCNIDSFGYSMVWLGLNEKFTAYLLEPPFPGSIVDDLDYEKLKVSWIIDKIEKDLSDPDNLRSPTDVV